MSKNAVHWSFWLIGIVTLVWNLMGAANYLMQMNPESVASYPESHRAIIEDRPAWATAGFAVAVFGGALGCALLLLRRSAALPVFIASFIGVIATTAHTVAILPTASFSGFEMTMMLLMPLVVAAFLIWHAASARRKGWTR